MLGAAHNRGCWETNSKNSPWLLLLVDIHHSKGRTATHCACSQPEFEFWHLSWNPDSCIEFWWCQVCLLKIRKLNIAFYFLIKVLYEIVSILLNVLVNKLGERDQVSISHDEQTVLMLRSSGRVFSKSWPASVRYQWLLWVQGIRPAYHKYEILSRKIQKYWI